MGKVWDFYQFWIQEQKWEYQPPAPSLPEDMELWDFTSVGLRYNIWNTSFLIWDFGISPIWTQEQKLECTGPYLNARSEVPCFLLPRLAEKYMLMTEGLFYRYFYIVRLR